MNNDSYNILQKNKSISNNNNDIINKNVSEYIDYPLKITQNNIIENNNSLKEYQQKCYNKNYLSELIENKNFPLRENDYKIEVKEQINEKLNNQSNRLFNKISTFNENILLLRKKIDREEIDIEINLNKKEKLKRQKLQKLREKYLPNSSAESIVRNKSQKSFSSFNNYKTIIQRPEQKTQRNKSYMNFSSNIICPQNNIQLVRNNSLKNFYHKIDLSELNNIKRNSDKINFLIKENNELIDKYNLLYTEYSNLLNNNKDDYIKMKLSENFNLKKYIKNYEVITESLIDFVNSLSKRYSLYKKHFYEVKHAIKLDELEFQKYFKDFKNFLRYNKNEIEECVKIRKRNENIKNNLKNKFNTVTKNTKHKKYIVGSGRNSPTKHEKNKMISKSRTDNAKKNMNKSGSTLSMKNEKYKNYFVFWVDNKLIKIKKDE